MRCARFLLLLMAGLPTLVSCLAQGPAFHFHHLGAGDGLSDGVVRAIGQDKYGYVWIATVSGLNRYNGYSVTLFQNTPGDSNSLPASIVRAILCERSGKLWVGCSRGLYQFDYAGSRWRQVGGTEGLGVTGILETGVDTICLATSRGVARLQPSTGVLSFYEDQGTAGHPTLLHTRVNDLAYYRGSLYVSTDSGLVITDPGLHHAMPIHLEPTGGRINKIAIDSKGVFWATYGLNDALLMRTTVAFTEFELFRDLYFSAEQEEGNSINALMTDSLGRIWLTTNFQGLLLYDPQLRQFGRYMNDPLQQATVAANHLTTLFRDRQGFIWAGTEGYGVDYFHPDRTLFRVITSSSIAIPGAFSNWARTAAEDRQGNLWFGWEGGLVRRTPDGQLSKIWQNKRYQQHRQLHSNSIRSLLCDDQGDLWICTTEGVNRYRTATGQMEFLGEKDSLPYSFYWCALQDRHKNIWLGDRADLHYYDAAEQRFHSIAAHPLLGRFSGKGVHCMLEDSRGRLWLGMNGAGLVMMDEDRKEVRSWMRTPANDSTLMGNVITSLAEDREGVIWISSFMGLVSYDPVKDQFTQYNRRNGLSSIKTSCLMVDAKDRLWIGSTSGILMLDSSRRHFRDFDLEDGLPAMEFNDQPAYRMRDGQFVFPSVKGFVLFDASSYEEDARAPVLYLSSLKIRGREYHPGGNYEELRSLNLGHDENFFSIELAALNYDHPQQTWYAYRLEPFDKDWVYTRDRQINYTNVPGDEYHFRYKATTDPNNWNVPERVAEIRIATVFYRASWFWLLTAIMVMAIVYLVFRYRLRQQERIYSLQNKAQNLEKEKALVMYESLKQQLNPHFLFNSLTSLGSLIRSDPRRAGEFLDSLSRSYRYILKNRNQEFVPLGEEIGFAESYIRLQKTRFDGGLQVTIDIGEEWRQGKIAPVTLQNLVENAIKHNIIDGESPLVIEIFTEADYVVVRNNLQRKKFVDSSNRQGLSNLRTLYHFLSERAVEVREEKEYFIVKIPLL